MMDKVILSQCPICSKTVRAIDSKKEAECDDLIPCDGNEYYTCYVSKENHSLRYLARKSKPTKYTFPK